MKKVLKHIPELLGLAGATSCFCFLFLKYPYHFYHQEQLTLYIPGTQSTAGKGIFQYIQQLGDFLTQFYYYVGIGPLLLTICLFCIGFICYLLCSSVLSHLKIQKEIALIPTFLLCGTEFWLACSTHYPLGNILTTLVVTGLLFLIYKAYKGRKIYNYIWVGIILSGLIYQTYRLSDEKLEGISLRLERFYAIDTEAYFGHWEKVKQLTQGDLQNYVSSYYHNLAMAKEGKVADGLLNYYQENTRSLLIPVQENESDFSISAASEAWFQMGDMTMAEHATILGMIFSPNHTGSRFIKRLAEINLIQGETKAAEKYLHLLSKTWVHRKWAEQHEPGKQTEPVSQTLNQEKKLLPKTDLLRLAGQNRASLFNLVNQNPDNILARDYLLCYDLLSKDLHTFGLDYMKYANGNYAPIYAQALLIIQSIEPEILKGCQMPMNQEILQQNQAYINQYTKNKGMQSAMKAFRNTYWYYYQYEKITH